MRSRSSRKESVNPKRGHRDLPGSPSSESSWCRAQDFGLQPSLQCATRGIMKRYMVSPFVCRGDPGVVGCMVPGVHGGRHHRFPTIIAGVRAGCLRACVSPVDAAHGVVNAPSRAIGRPAQVSCRANHYWLRDGPCATILHDPMSPLVELRNPVPRSRSEATLALAILYSIARPWRSLSR